MIIPLEAYPNQSLTVILNKQKCFITIKQKTTGVFISVEVDNKVMIVGQIALDKEPVLFEDYRGFKGTLIFEGEIDYLNFNRGTTLNYYA